MHGTAESEHTLSYAWIILALLLLSQLVMSMGAYGWGPLASFIRDEFCVSRAQFGFLTSALYLASVIIAIPSGFLVDKLGARIMLIFSLIIMGCAFCFIPTAGTFWVVIMFAALGGIGYGIINQVSTKGIMLWFPRKTRATAMGIKQMGVTLGAALSAIILPILALAKSWKLSVFIDGALMILMALIVIICYREHPPKRIDVAGEEKEIPPKTTPIKIIYNPMLLALVVVMPFLAFSQSSIAAFLVLYLNEGINLPVSIAGSCLTVAMIAGTVGRIAWGMASDNIFRGNRVKPSFILTLTGAVSIGGIGIIHEGASLATVVALSALIGFTAIGWNALLMTLGAEIVGPERAGSFMGISIAIAWMGIVSGPPVFGYLVDIFSYGIAWMALSLAFFVGSIGFAYMLFLQRDGRSAVEDRK